jgi:hypothetical protein
MDSKENESSKPESTSKPTEGRSATNAIDRSKPTSEPSEGRPITKGK